MNTAAPVLDQLSIVADAFRARTLEVLPKQELTVSELCDVLQLPQSTVSRHLKMLADGGWVASRREGTSRYYSLTLEDLDPGRRQLWLLIHEQISATAEAAQDQARLQSVLTERSTKSRAFFASTAGQWDRVRAELFGDSSHLPPLLALLDPDWVVGDLGCGTGQASEALAPFVGRVVAVDNSGEMLDAARLRLGGHSNVQIRPGALERLPVADNELDAAFLILVLHHTSDPGLVLAETSRALKPGGRLLVADMLPHDHDEYRQAMGHVWLGFSERQMERWLTAAGFGGVRWRALPVQPGTKGPGLFAASGYRGRS
jgi:ArsR family transcriptional regulator